MHESSIFSQVTRPIDIGSKPLPNRLFLAPMAGLGHIAFRHLVADFGGFGLLFTGMCSARAVPQENPKISSVFSFRKEELDHTVCQIFGSTQEDMAKAAQRIEAEGFFGVDLNFGCSVAGICKKGAGAALLRNPHQAARIVEAVRRAVSCPVFVKFRTGWQDMPTQPANLAALFERAGADALVFHPRLAPDRRTRPPKWELIGQVQNAVSIPVFGNGNIFDKEDAVNMLTQGPCQGISLGRMAVARPWIFAQWTGNLQESDSIYQETAARMAELMNQYFPQATALTLFKKFARYFCANFRFSHEIYKKMIRANNMKDIQANIDELLTPCPERLSRPSTHMFLG
ncbi:MAG: tRNA-dihydrouridine synthase [Desulfobacterales bacterium]|nr:MAG: tRNA-dihydrouridine synthase [Desulfobacterales bacterium]